MKEIPNLQLNENDTTVSMLKGCLDAPPKEGLDMSMIRARNRVLDVIEKVAAGDIIKFEDADYVTAQSVIRSSRWVNVGKHIIKFAEQFAL